MLIARDKLATSTHAVTDTPHCGATLLLDRQRTDDTDTHTVTARELPPTRPLLLRSAQPKLDPRSVTLAPPVAAKFFLTALLTDTPSCVNASSAHIRGRTTVATHASRMPAPLVALQRTDDSDVHAVP
jgi:hypothetical protein